MKRPGDGWTKITWYKCPECGKKGYYWKYSGTGKDWFCKYCKTSGLQPNRYIIACDPCDKDGDHTVMCIKIPGDDIIELMDYEKQSADREHMIKTIFTAFGVPKKYWGMDKNKPK